MLNSPSSRGRCGMSASAGYIKPAAWIHTYGTPVPFVMDIKTDNLSSGSTADNQFKIPLRSTQSYDFDIDWGDGSPIQNWISDEGPTHTYTVIGTYTVQILGKFPQIYFDNGNDRLKILDIKAWGNVPLTSLQSAFRSCSNLVITATDTPNLSNVTHLGATFRSCASMANIPNLHLWRTARVDTMNRLFQGCSIFDGVGMSGWDTRSLTNVGRLMLNAVVADVDISLWDFSNIGSANFMMDGSSFGTVNYDKALISLDAQSVTQNLNIGFGSAQYSPGAATTARTSLVVNDLWTITDGGPI